MIIFCVLKALLKSVRTVSQEFVAVFQGVTELLMAPGQHPGCSGTRNLHDNLSDLRAQVAANQKVSRGGWGQDMSHDRLSVGL